ncbi:hypothetical protein HMPREF9453_01202 [Dialister succinatiphilus YIT 11850]|uniref:Uncharacterized protein n=1 Tax=Dialister succinatiphilus YIT 11850 TaxID=742743 RepID=H1D0R4_9FIRM|nr:hypothetical protein HMPREF9453_01202 [Dialister succinatiphilus YIT 11850]
MKNLYNRAFARGKTCKPGFARGMHSPFGGWRHHLSPASGGTIELRYAVSDL